MNSTLLATLLFFSLTQWKIYKDLEGKFSIKTPCETMKHNSQIIKTSIGELEYHSLICTPTESEAENKVYIISYMDYPSDIIHTDSTELRNDLLEETIASTVKNVEGELAYKDDVQLKGVKGKFWRINYNHNSAVLKNKAFIVGRRLYLVQVATNRAKSRNLEADTYLDSFSWF
ncbi:MAG: hypothetical protein ACOYOA_09790, partial [Saprospiraceae bacterium]